MSCAPRCLGVVKFPETDRGPGSPPYLMRSGPSRSPLSHLLSPASSAPPVPECSPPAFRRGTIGALTRAARQARRQRRSAVEGDTHPIARDGLHIKGRKAIVALCERGLIFVAQEERRLDHDFLLKANGLRHVRHNKIRPDVNNPG